MVTEANSSSDLESMDWALHNDLWNGRRVEWPQKSELEGAFQEIMAKAGFKNHYVKFWKKHRVEILVGLSMRVGLETAAQIALFAAQSVASAIARRIKIEPIQKGVFDPSKHLILLVPGINNPEKEAQGHIEYLKSLCPGIEVHLVLNKSHGTLLDGMEVLFLNYFGFSFHTSDALIQIWEKFDQKHQDDPKAKILQLCHSQGTLLVRIAAAKASQTIRDRLSIVAIAPAALFSEQNASEIARYASKRDPIIPNFEVLLKSITALPEEEGLSEMTKTAWRNQDLVIRLEPHPDAPLFDHNFQSPTFREVLRRTIEDYLKN